jgi:hypothetical protein
MTELQIESPLRFPDGWERTLPHQTMFNPQFAQNVNITDGVRYVQDEVTAIQANSAKLFTNYNSLLSDRSRTKQGLSEGASLQITVGSCQAFLACDRWQSLAQNLYALHLAIRHTRLFQDWGIVSTERILGIFDSRPTTKQINTSDTYVPEWMQFLGLGSTATLADANAIYRQRAKIVAHDEDALLQLNQAIEQARASLRS